MSQIFTSAMIIKGPYIETTLAISSAIDIPVFRDDAQSFYEVGN